jgi:CobQ-like glutamine amidotransferase family enzyme
MVDLRIAHLYPDLMNIYGDRGNVIVLQRRCLWRGITPITTPLGLDDEVDAEQHDLFFVGGGQDRDQQRMARDLRERKGAAILAAAAVGKTILSVCGGYQLLGKSYRDADGRELEGVGLFDAWTVHSGLQAVRKVGNALIRCDWDAQCRSLVGFENHGGLTHLAPDAQPLGAVLSGFGNNGRDGKEGIVKGNAYGTYLHGSLLPKNPWFADHLIVSALRTRYGPSVELPALDDTLEIAAHVVMSSRLSATAHKRH